MYSQRQKRTNTYCPVCHKAGKDISVYQSHNINEGNKVVCPLLLSQKCNYCGEVGHTPKYCKAKKCDEKHERTQCFHMKEKKTIDQKKEKKTNSGMFAVLNDKKEKKEKKDKKEKKEKKEKKNSSKLNLQFPQEEQSKWTDLFSQKENDIITKENKIADGFIEITSEKPIVISKEVAAEDTEKSVSVRPLRRKQMLWSEMESDDELFEEDPDYMYDNDDNW